MMSIYFLPTIEKLIDGSIKEIYFFASKKKDKKP